MFGLTTERLVIRPWQQEDRPAFTSLMIDTEVTRFIHGGKPYTEDEVDQFLARQSRQMAEHDMCMGAAVERESDRIVGIAGVQPLGATSDLEVGWIFERASWGRGYATEAGAAAMKYVLETLMRPRVVAIIDPENAPSKRVASRLGMSYEARYTGVELGHRFPEIVVDLYFRDAERRV
ncbi:MAG: GNAT family N-acetyltransferase [Acidobacteriota bacterium]